jgi:hypothetical protein
MNVLELAAVALVLLAGYFAGALVGGRFGLPGWVAGWLLGMAGASGALYALRKSLDLWYRHFPLRPVCAKERCGEQDYEFIRHEQGGTLFRCKCGDLYLRRGRQFLHVTSSGGTEQFQEYRGLFRRWQAAPQDRPASSSL